MSRRQVFLIVGLVVLAVVYVSNWGRLGVRFVRSPSSYMQTFDCVRSDVESRTARTYSRFGVVAMPAALGARGFQSALMDSVCSKLRNTRCVHMATVGNPHDSRTNPSVTIYSSRAEALRDGVQCLIMVRTKEWKCSLLPFHKSWSACVGIGVAPPSPREGRLKHVEGVLLPQGEMMSFKAGFDYRGSGTASGIFTTPDIVDDVTAEIAGNLVQSLDKEFSEAMAKHIKGEPQFKDAP